ncbi:Gcv operon activator [Kingella potus]|uniref:Gcv operon activator n=1 Tax=Kingella potus TaxID=265175 RepID=A0A377R3R8_9NEIS|nr:LysR substrate-binding domain-containing protein [Kingella potus]UOP00318.1 LysR substrate-binding domain-containing protein [Kingella potus]STR02622.1 Gcv operon activator [Kingella potus]
MPRFPFSLDALHAFEAAARLGSFKHAAAELAVTATAVSHRIRLLETQIGKPLFERKVRAVVLTEDGKILSDAVGRSLAAVADAVAQIRHAARQSVIVSLTPEFAVQWLMPRLSAFQAACPEIELHIRAGYDLADLTGGGADLAVRYGDGVCENTDETELFRERFAPVAAPSLLARLGSDTAQWPLIHLDWHNPGQTAIGWNEWAKAAGVPLQNVQRGIRYSDATHLMRAAVAGQGVAIIGKRMAAAELDSGLLQPVRPPS